jgi:glycosyltransferase involved in cell wall biosynthesis
MDSSSGIQVLITSKNCAPYLSDCFASIEAAMSGYKWMLIFCDDVSTDNTEEIINSYKLTTTADQVVYQKYTTPASSIGEAKNRCCLLALDHKNDYPVICFMDADDLMGQERISGLLPHLSDTQQIVFGDYMIQRYKDGSWVAIEETRPNSEGEVFKGVVTTSMREDNLTFGYWCTLVHSDLLPNDGVFFREDIQNYDDFLTWWQLKYEQNVNFVPVPGFITHYYKINREGSVGDEFKAQQKEILDQLFTLKSGIHPIPGFE